jgi:hypothetical protein
MLTKSVGNAILAIARRRRGDDWRESKVDSARVRVLLLLLLLLRVRVSVKSVVRLRIFVIAIADMNFRIELRATTKIFFRVFSSLWIFFLFFSAETLDPSGDDDVARRGEKYWKGRKGTYDC